MKKLYLNNEEIFTSKYSSVTSYKDEDDTLDLFLSFNIRDAKEYNEASKIKNAKVGDILKVTSSNALVKITTEMEIEEVVSYNIYPDEFLNYVASMYFKFKIKKDVKESMTDLTKI